MKLNEIRNLETSRLQRFPDFHPKLMTIILASVFSSHLAFAENRAETLETGTIDVVGTTPLSSLGLPINEVPSNVQAVKGEALQVQQSLNLTDYMNQNLTGININETQNNPYQPDVNFHGFTASPLLGTPQGLSVYQDGVRINEPFGDTVNWDLIPQNAIAGITLMPGSNPLFGLNTLGGALSIQTKSGEYFPGGAIQAYGGSWGRHAIEAEYGGKLKNGFSYFFAGNRFKEDGWRDGSPSDVLQGFGKIGWSNDKTDIDVSFIGADTDLTGNGYTPETMLGEFGYQSIYTKPDNTKNNLGFINGKISHWFSDELLLTANGYYRNNRTKTLNGDVNDSYEALVEACDDLGAPDCDANFDHGAVNRTTTHNQSYGGTVQMTWQTERNQLIGGGSIDIGDTRFRQTEQGSVSGNGVAFDSARGLVGVDGSEEVDNDLTGYSETWSLFATDTFNITPELSVTASGRYNETRVKTVDNLAGQKEGTCLDATTGQVTDCDDPGAIPVTGLGVPSQDISSSHTYSRFNPAVGLTYSFLPDQNFYFGYNEGNRAPSPIETACSDPAFPCLLPNAMAGDPPLKQVVAKTYEGGFRGKFGKDIRWTAGAYTATNYDDLQFVASGTTGAGYFTNVGKTRRTGVDFGINGVTGDFTWSLGYSYIDATYEDGFQMVSQSNSTRDADGFITVSKGDKLAGIPEHQLKARGEWRVIPNWTIAASVLSFSDQFARGNENNKHQADGVTYLALAKLLAIPLLIWTHAINLVAVAGNCLPK